MKKKPKHIYKYRSFNNIEFVLDIIKNHRLYFPTKDELNDPLEGLCQPLYFTYMGIDHYIENGQGMVIGYRLYNQLGLTSQISKNVELLSNALSENRKTVSNIKVSRLDLNFDATTCRALATLEILQNYRHIEDINRQQLAEYMQKYALDYSEESVVKVLTARKYQKSTIAFLASFLDFWNIEHTLPQYLSRLSTYAFPQMEEFYPFA